LPQTTLIKAYQLLSQTSERARFGQWWTF